MCFILILGLLFQNIFIKVKRPPFLLWTPNIKGQIHALYSLYNDVDLQLRGQIKAFGSKRPEWLVIKKNQKIMIQFSMFVFIFNPFLYYLTDDGCYVLRSISCWINLKKKSLAVVKHVCFLLPGLKPFIVFLMHLKFSPWHTNIPERADGSSLLHGHISVLPLRFLHSWHWALTECQPSFFLPAIQLQQWAKLPRTPSRNCSLKLLRSGPLKV